MPIIYRPFSRLFSLFSLCLLFLSSQANAITIPRYEIPTGQFVIITSDYERNLRYWNDKQQQSFEREANMFLRVLIHVDEEKRTTDHDEWALLQPVHKKTTSFRMNPVHDYKDHELHGVKVRFYFDDEQAMLLPYDKDKKLELTKKQRESVMAIAKGQTYFNTITQLASAQDYELNKEVTLEPEVIKKYLTGESGTIKLKAMRLMWEKNVAEFEINLKLADSDDKSFSQQDRTCKLFFWVLAESGHPVNFSNECKIRGVKNELTFHNLEYISRGFSYSNFPLSTISPRPTPALQPNGKILGVEFSDELQQLVFLTAEYNTDTSWLTFWDIQQRKALNIVKAPGKELHITDDGKSVYSISNSRIMNGWRKISNKYEEFGSIAHLEKDFGKNYISSDLLGVYPVTLNEEHEIEVWNPGYQKRIFLQKLKYSKPAYLSVAPDGRLVTIDKDWNVTLHTLKIDASACNTDIYKSYCNYPDVSFKESKDSIKITTEIEKWREEKDKQLVDRLQLHPTEPVIGYCTVHPALCGLINYKDKTHVLLRTESNINFTDDGKVITDQGILDLKGDVVKQYPGYHNYYSGSAISNKHKLVFNQETGLQDLSDNVIHIRSSINGSIIDTIERQVYPVKNISSFGNGLAFVSSGFNQSQLSVLDFNELFIQTNPLNLIITNIDFSNNWAVMQSYKVSFLFKATDKQNPITLQFPISAYVLLEDYFVYARDKIIYHLDLNTRKTTKLYEFDSPIHEIVVFDDTGKQLAARLNRGIVALPHVNKKLDLAYYGATSNKTMAFDPVTQTFFVSNINDKNGIFNTGINFIQPFSTTGESRMMMEPLWHTDYVILPTPNGQLWSGSDKGDLVIRDIQSGLVLEEIADAHQGKINAIKLVDNNTVVTASSDGTMKLWRTDMPNGKFKHPQQNILYNQYVRDDIGKRNPKLIATIIVDREYDFIINTPDGYYWSTPKALHRASFLNGDEIFDYTQYDFWLNRPDIVLERLGKSNSETIEHWKKVVSFRKGRYPNKSDRLPTDQTPPSFKISGPDQVVTEHDVTFNYELENKDDSDATLHVLVNQIPIYGTKGKPIDKNKGAIKLELTVGINKIKAYVDTESGLQSESQFLTYNKPYDGQLPDLYLLSIGVSDYELDTIDLNYAAKDAKDLQALLAQSKQFNNVHAKTLLDTEVTVENVKSAKVFIEQARPSDRVIVFFAGHGFLDSDNNYFFGTTDVDPYQPQENGLAYSHITDLLDGIPSRHKLLMLDTCHSGEAIETTSTSTMLAEGVQARGIKLNRGAEKTKDSLNLSFELLQKTFVDLRSATGTIVISASGGQEFALEKSNLKNGVFTASVIRGLGEKAADANKDGTVSISELRAFTYSEVSRLTGGKQKPTTRQNNLDIDFTLY